MNLSIDAQTPAIAGEYTKRGNHEMVSAFMFRPDSTFEFYFVYGAVDRMAKGTYTLKNGKAILHGEKIPARDFTIKGKKTTDAGTTLKVNDPTPGLASNVMCIFEKGETRDIQYSDQDGNIHSKLTDCNNIFVMHMLYRDIMTTVRHGMDADKFNHFELTLNPSLAQVCFKDFEFTIEGDTLKGSMPYLWEEENSVFTKQ